MVPVFPLIFDLPSQSTPTRNPGVGDGGGDLLGVLFAPKRVGEDGDDDFVEHHGIFCDISPENWIRCITVLSPLVFMLSRRRHGITFWAPAFGASLLIEPTKKPFAAK